VVPNDYLFANNDFVDVTSPGLNGKPLGKESSWYIGSEKIDVVSSKLFQSKFIPGKSQRHSFGMGNKRIWVRVKLDNPSHHAQVLYIFDSQNTADELTIYHGNSVIGSLSKQDSLAERIIKVEVPAKNKIIIYISRLSYGAQFQSWTYWSSLEELRHEIRASERNLGIILTIFVMSLLFNCMFFFAYRSKFYIYYMIYLVSICFYTAGLWSVIGSPYVFKIIHTFGAIGAIGGGLFSIDFLQLKRNFPKIRILALSLASIYLIPLILTYVAPQYVTVVAITIGAVGSFAALVIALHVFVNKKEVYVLIYIIAYGTFLIGNTLQMLIWGGFLNALADFQKLVFYSAAIENLIMLSAMGYKVYRTEKERIHGSRLLQQEMIANQRKELITSQYVAITKTTQMLIHDIKKPIAIISEYINILEQPASQQKFLAIKNEFANDLKESICFIEELMADILQLKMEESSKADFHSLVSIVDAAWSIVYRKNRHNIVFETNFAHKSQPIFVNKLKFKRVLINLLDNALAATNSGGWIKVKSSLNKFDNKVIINIGNGDGINYIPYDLIRNLFDPFVTAGKEGGTGLGLTVVQKIVNEHEGEVTVKSSKDGGTWFSISLPALNAPELPAVSSQSTLRLAVVEDTLIYHSLWQKSPANFRVDIFDNPKDFWTYSYSHPEYFGQLDCIVTDFYFNGFPGDIAIAFAAKIKRIRPSLPVFLCSEGGRIDLDDFDEKIPKFPDNWMKLAKLIEYHQRKKAGLRTKYTSLDASL